MSFFTLNYLTFCAFCHLFSHSTIDSHLGIGSRQPPARLVFERETGDAVVTTLIDMGGHFQLICQNIHCVKPIMGMPNLPVARVMWQAEPSLEMGLECWITAGFSCPELDGKYFLVIGTRKYFKNVQYAPAVNLGLVRLADGGETAQLLWGFGRFTSEFPAHMMSHAARLRIAPQNRVVMQCHPANLLAMTYVHTLDEKAFTRTLWQMCTECIVVFPGGVNVLPWMLCGTNEIGESTAEKMKTSHLVV